MTEKILELYPANGEPHHLEGLYLSHNLRQQSGNGDVYIYANFIASIDGRIALPVSGKKSRQVPAAIGNARDWRLYQELAAQADLLITSARYFRQANNHEAQDNLPVGSAKTFDDLRTWRLDQGLVEQPDIAVFSASLDIPVAALQVYRQRKITIFTGADADPDLRDRLSHESHVEVVSCGKGRYVDGKMVRNRLQERGYRFVYAIAGPSVFHTLVAGQAVDRLYLTTAQKMLGGTAFDTIIWGEQLNPPPKLSLQSLYLDPHSPADCGQTFAVYDFQS